MSFFWVLVRLLVVSSALIGVNAAPFRSAKGELLDKRFTTSSVGTCSGGLWYIADAGVSYNSRFSVDFTASSSLPSELIISDNTIGQGVNPYARQFLPGNVIPVPGSYLEMIVPGGQATTTSYAATSTQTPTIESAQMVTGAKDILYASVRTVAQLSPVAGTVAGFFFYSNDTQEVDIEIRTFETNEIWYTNQQTVVYGPNGPLNTWYAPTSYNMSGPSDMTSAFHEYRYDWTAAGVNYYLDGVLQMSITTNVPSIPGQLMWNNWANGDAWTLGPPIDNNILLIQSIDAYFNHTVVTPTACSLGHKHISQAHRHLNDNHFDISQLDQLHDNFEANYNVDEYDFDEYDFDEYDFDEYIGDTNIDQRNLKYQNYDFVFHPRFDLKPCTYYDIYFFADGYTDFDNLEHYHHHHHLIFYHQHRGECYSNVDLLLALASAWDDFTAHQQPFGGSVIGEEPERPWEGVLNLHFDAKTGHDFMKRNDYEKALR
ncbi:hypothetical protein MBLNU459_g5417t1 [Dothideomycetes sp. NU459]